MERIRRTSTARTPSYRSFAALTAATLVAALLADGAAPAGAHDQSVPAHRVNTWLPTGPMESVRTGQTATLLSDGQVLVAGGGTATAELYDPDTRTFTPTGSMSVARTDATATLLADGDVLVAGGLHGSRQLATAELYDPSTGAWSVTGSMHAARSGMTATRLGDGDVLIAGGGCNPGKLCNAGSFLNSLHSAEVYDPGTGRFSHAGLMSAGRQFGTATLLSDGDVLVAGGFSDCDDDFCEDTTSADLYNPTTGTWTAVGQLLVPREQSTATLLPSGQVLVAGGKSLTYDGYSYKRLAEAELYDPRTRTWTATGSLAQPHAGASAALLSNGWVLVAGGGNPAAAVYQPKLGAWVPTGSMNTHHTDGAAAVLSNGDVLVTGGGVSSAETYQTGRGPLVALTPTAMRFKAQQVGSTSSVRKMTLTNDGDGRLRVVGLVVSGPQASDFVAGDGCSTPVLPRASCTISVTFSPTAPGRRTASVKVVDNAPSSPQIEPISGYGQGPNAWVPTSTLSTARSSYAAATLHDGDVLIAGGESGVQESTSSAELFDPTSQSFTTARPLHEPRGYVNAAVLRDGRVLIAGGLDGDTRLASAELYDPTSDRWSTAAPMNESGYALTETLLNNGNVLVTGTGDGTDAEVYNPGTNTWTNTPSTIGVGLFSTATLLPDGQVLAMGDGTRTAGLYDPRTNTWSATGSMITARSHTSAALLSTGDVLVAGGENSQFQPLASAELYDPTAGTWKSTSNQMSHPRSVFAMAVTPNGVVLAMGGCATECQRNAVTSSTDVYNIVDGYWFPGPAMIQSRAAMTAAVLHDGDVLVAGGGNYCCRVYKTSELYTSTDLTAIPASGQVGQTIKLRGHGFYAFETVKLYWDYQTLAKAHAGPKGGFSIPVVVPQSTVGQHTIRARGLRSYAGATTVFTVTGS